MQLKKTLPTRKHKLDKLGRIEFFDAVFTDESRFQLCSGPAQLIRKPKGVCQRYEPKNFLQFSSVMQKSTWCMAQFGL